MIMPQSGRNRWRLPRHLAFVQKQMPRIVAL
jgi:hypothetical protein